MRWHVRRAGVTVNRVDRARLQVVNRRRSVYFFRALELPNVRLGGDVDGQGHMHISCDIEASSGEAVRNTLVETLVRRGYLLCRTRTMLVSLQLDWRDGARQGGGSSDATARCRSSASRVG